MKQKLNKVLVKLDQIVYPNLKIAWILKNMFEVIVIK